MDSINWVTYKIQLSDRLKIFALKILELSDQIPNSMCGRIINNQLTKSGTSVYANYRASLRVRSKAEFFAKLSITVEEADETEMWRDLLIDANISNTGLTKPQHAESLGRIKMLALLRKGLNKN